MDECMGSFMPLWPYCDVLLKKVREPVRTALYRDMVQTLATQSFQAQSSVWLFRPAFLTILTNLRVAQLSGQIHGCFILSNNGSAMLVETVRRILNLTAERFGGGKRPLFYAGWHRTAPCRRGILGKSWKLIQHCLKATHLPVPHNSSDLLFFDDLEHPLMHETPNYIQVPAYFNNTPYLKLFRILQPLLQKHGVDRDLQNEILRLAESSEKEDVRDEVELQLTPPSPKVKQETVVFLNALTQFLRSPSDHGRTRTQTRRQPRRQLKHTKRTVTRKSIWDKY